MRVKVDLSRCEDGERAFAAEEVVELGDDNVKVTLLQDEPPGDQGANVHEAARARPTSAITVE